jgi:hypothetical protein
MAMSQNCSGLWSETSLTSSRLQTITMRLWIWKAEGDLRVYNRIQVPYASYCLISSESTICNGASRNSRFAFFWAKGVQCRTGGIRWAALLITLAPHGRKVALSLRHMNMRPLILLDLEPTPLATIGICMPIDAIIPATQLCFRIIRRYIGRSES